MTVLNTMSAPAGSPAPFVAGRTLCPLVMVGDPDIATTRRLLQACADLGVGMVELCLPFENAFTDGPTLQRAHARALRHEVGLAAALSLIREFSSRLRIVLLADCSFTLRRHGFAETCRAAQEAGAAAILPHGMPPRLAPDFRHAAHGTIPIVGSLYRNSTPQVSREVIATATAFIYFVTSYGRSGGPSQAIPDLTADLAGLRARTDLPLALGFGLKTAADVAAAFGMGCDIAIVGSAISAAIESGIGLGDPAGPAIDLIAELSTETRR